MIDPRSIDWDNPAAKISRYFTVKEAIWLPKWGRLASMEDGLTDHVKEQICRFAWECADEIRLFIGLPVIVHCWFRPRKYNRLIGGAPASKHLSEGDWSAFDWHANVPGARTVGESCDILRAALEPMLEKLGVRMEDNGAQAVWIHNDNAPVARERYFRP